MRRSYLFSLIALLPALAACRTTAAPTAIAPTVIAPTVSASNLCKRAMANMDDGMWFDSDIADLMQAVKQDPDNSDYHLALGCAEVDRAGSLAYAAFMTDQWLNDQSKYPNDYAQWRADQNDPKSYDFGEPAPAPPQRGMRFRTKDDLTHLKLTGRQAVARIVALGQAAQKEWLQAVEMTKKPEQRAQAESVGGWGLEYEVKLLRDTDYENRHIPEAPNSDEAIAAFRAAVKDDPSNAAYWEGLGDAYAGTRMDDLSHAPAAVAAWKKSLSLGPGNTGLRFRLYLAQSKTDPKAALETLKQLAAADPSNSYVQYILAALLFKQVHYNEVYDRFTPDMEHMSKDQAAEHRTDIARELGANDNAQSERIAAEALSAIEKGNAGFQFERPSYAPPVPKVMWHAWSYWSSVERENDPSYILYGATLRDLARASGGYAAVAADKGDIDGGVRAARACMGMGLKLAGDWPLRDRESGDGDVIQTLVGAAIAAIGYADLELVYQIAGDPVMLQETTMEYAAFRQEERVYIAAVKQTLQTDPPHLYDNY
jgi:cytochrome c-type biogenesis protein CcmH/NrfG